jgi:hypothetical protein
MISGACHCGAVSFTFQGRPDAVTACNCTVCRRYGTLWAYDHDGHGIKIIAAPDAVGVYMRAKASLGFHFCKTCACVTHWRALERGADGRRRIAVNLRMAAPEDVATLPLQRFDGLNTWDDLPQDGRCVADIWF